LFIIIHFVYQDTTSRGRLKKHYKFCFLLYILFIIIHFVSQDTTSRGRLQEHLRALQHYELLKDSVDIDESDRFHLNNFLSRVKFMSFRKDEGAGDDPAGGGSAVATRTAR
jgi:hypothetical protein